MPGTRVKFLADLEAWAVDDISSKVYWLVGMAGTGKSTISHSLCEILDGKNMLGASFFLFSGIGKRS
jgi:adenylylsulfate kinase-like enzyme